MTHFNITVSGCDDSTTVIVPLEPADLLVVQRIAELITAASQFGCMPTMTIRPALAHEIEGTDD